MSEAIAPPHLLLSEPDQVLHRISVIRKMRNRQAHFLSRSGVQNLLVTSASPSPPLPALVVMLLGGGFAAGIAGMYGFGTDANEELVVKPPIPRTYVLSPLPVTPKPQPPQQAPKPQPPKQESKPQPPQQAPKPQPPQQEPKPQLPPTPQPAPDTGIPPSPLPNPSSNRYTPSDPSQSRVRPRETIYVKDIVNAFKRAINKAAPAQRQKCDLISQESTGAYAGSQSAEMNANDITNQFGHKSFDELSQDERQRVIKIQSDTKCLAGSG